MLFGNIHITYTIGRLIYLTVTITTDNGKKYRYWVSKNHKPNFFHFIDDNFQTGDRVVFSGYFDRDESGIADYIISNLCLGPSCHD